MTKFMLLFVYITGKRTIKGHYDGISDNLRLILRHSFAFL